VTNGVNVSVKSAALADGVMGLWDPAERTIWLDSGLTQGERRCTLMHELVHAERGDGSCATALDTIKREVTVHHEAARRLLPLSDVARALLVCVDEYELADELVVDVDTVRLRLERLTAAERSRLDELVRSAETSWVARWRLRPRRVSSGAGAAVALAASLASSVLAVHH
jgi:hypothetical protein